MGSFQSIPNIPLSHVWPAENCFPWNVLFLWFLWYHSLCVFFLSLPSTSLLVPWPLSIPAVFLQTSALGPVSLLCFLASPELQILRFKCFQNFSTWTPHRLLRVNIQSSLSTLHCSRYPETTITSEISANKQHLASPQGFPISANGTPLATHLLPQLEIWSHPLFSLTPKNHPKSTDSLS